MNILDITSEVVNSFCNDPSAISSKGAVKLMSDISFSDIENSNVHIAYIKTSLVVDKDRYMLLPDITANAQLRFTIKVVFSIEKEEIFSEAMMLEIAEPYIRKEIFDFCEKFQLPKFQLAYHYWKNSNAEQLSY